MSEDDKMPVVVMMPQVQAQADADPELAKALRGMNESLLNAMQGVKDGRYKTFDDAVEAMTGQRPQLVRPPNPPKHGYFMSVSPNPKGDGCMAVITDGHPNHGHDPIEVMDVEWFATEAEAGEWFQKTCPLLAWRE